MSKQLLYLMSSFRATGVADQVMSEVERKLGKTPQDIKILYITTAGNLHAPAERTWINKGRKLIEARGWQLTNYDITDKTEAEVAAAMQNQDVVFIQGGQCLYMLEQTQRCNFTKLIKDALARGAIYFGESTGSIITGKDISPYRYLSKDRRENPPVLASYAGFGLVNFLICPHWNNLEKREKYIRAMREHLDEYYGISQPIISLNDNQFIRVNGSDLQILEA